LEGVSFFLQHIYPLLPGAIPFHIIGYGSEALRPFSATFPSVTAHGFVPDPSVFFNNAILVCPIFNGGGTRLKVLSAFAAGVPVISTPRGVEGLGCVDGIHVLLASSARQFVDRITAILHDQQLYSAIRHAAFQFVRDQYSWERIGDGYVKMLSRFSKPSP
jgi:glycosyltransferase involved in cell wall biosynthesis